MRNLFSLEFTPDVSSFRGMIKGLFLTSLLCSFITLAYAEDEVDDHQEPLWSPSVGDSWTYKVSVEVAKSTTLPPGIPGQKIEELEGKVRATYEQTAVYHGFLPLSEGGPKAHAFYFSNGEQLEEIQYMLIEKNAVKALGSKQEGKNPKRVISLSKPIPIIDYGWKGGEAFPVVMDQSIGGKKMRMTRWFRAIGWEDLETKAGNFKALHIQVTGMNGGLELKRGYWFAPGTGFIKEDKKYYLGDKMIMNQSRELIKIGNQQPAQ